MSSKGEERFSDECDEEYPETSASESDTLKELATARQTNKRLEHKLQLLKQLYEKELSFSNELRVDDIFKNSGGQAIEYMESHKKIIRAKDDMIAELRNETDRLRREVTALREQCKRASKLNEHYCQRLRELESDRSRLESSMPSMSREQSINQERLMIDSSPAPSYDESRVPPPPAIDVPSIDEMLRIAKSPPPLDHSQRHLDLNNQQQSHDSRLYSSTNSSQYNGLNMLDNSIPPPPLEDVDFDEIFKEISYGPQSGSRLG